MRIILRRMCLSMMAFGFVIGLIIGAVLYMILGFVCSH